MLDIRNFFRYFKRLRSHSTGELKTLKKCMRFSALNGRIGTGMYSIRATQRDAASRSDASGSCRVDSTEDFSVNVQNTDHSVAPPSTAA